MNQVKQFIKSIQYNFDEQSKSYQQIQSEENRQRRVNDMVKALLKYRHDRNSWDEMLMKFSDGDL